MPILFRGRSAAVCYYCQSTITGGSSSLQPHRPFDPSFFCCPYCGCRNRYDARGQIIGDEPAMHDEKLNLDSFRKRGSPDRNHFPSLSFNTGSGIFCHTCQTNQTLLINLLASFLPSPDDPAYASRSLQLPEYTASLHRRYPPVCSSCAPGVESEIAKRNEMARTRALGSALKVSSGRSSPIDRAANAGVLRQTTRRSRKLYRFLSKARGLMWSVGLVSAIVGNFVGSLNISVPLGLHKLVPLLPVLVLLSLFWTFWIPIYAPQPRSTASGNKLRVEGRHIYKILQLQAWLSRFISSMVLLCAWYRPDQWDILCIYGTQSLRKHRNYFSCALAFEFVIVFYIIWIPFQILLLSYFSIRIHKPSRIRLVDARHALESVSHGNSRMQSSIFASPAQPDDLLASLSLSNNPLLSSGGANPTMNPMFGRPSFGAGVSVNTSPWTRNSERGVRINHQNDNRRAVIGQDHDIPGIELHSGDMESDAMDWEPDRPKKKQLVRERTDDVLGDGSWLRRQRFFPPEEPTGLEGLLMRTQLVDDGWADRNSRGTLSSSVPSSEGVSNGHGRTADEAVRWHWGWVYWISIVPVVMLGMIIVFDKRLPL